MILGFDGRLVNDDVGPEKACYQNRAIRAKIEARFITACMVLTLPLILISPFSPSVKIISIFNNLSFSLYLSKKIIVIFFNKFGKRLKKKTNKFDVGGVS